MRKDVNLNHHGGISTKLLTSILLFLCNNAFTSISLVILFIRSNNTMPFSLMLLMQMHMNNTNSNIFSQYLLCNFFDLFFIPPITYELRIGNRFPEILRLGRNNKIFRFRE